MTQREAASTEAARMAERRIGLALATFGSRLRFEDIPRDVRTIAKQCVLDWLGVTLAGAREEVARVVLTEALEQGGAPQATILGTGLRTGVLQAALVNGTASHALDLDDVQYARGIHASVSVLPAVLAVAERDGRNGRDVMTSFVAGVEMACRVGLFVTDAHRQRGYHATGTVGTLGAATGAARILDLSVADTAAAIGIAATQAAGLMAMFGTMCKPLHAGKAASNGLHAALLAARGLSSRADALECARGFADVLSAGGRPEAALSGLGRDFQLRGVLFKHRAACYSTHASIEAAARVRAAHALDPADIETVEVRVCPDALTTCNILTPQTGLEAKFSLRLLTAMALCGRSTSDVGSFSDALCIDPELVAVRDAVTVVGDAALARGVSEVIASCRGGAVHRATWDASRPNEDLMDQWRRLEEKFASLASPTIGSARVREVIDRVQDLEHQDRAADLVRACADTRSE